MAQTSTLRSDIIVPPDSPAMMFRHWLRVLHVSNFRNYQDVAIRLENKPIVLVGKNGAGKTNLMEAISLLAPGRGLRRAGKGEVANANLSSSRWAVAAELMTDDVCWQLGTGIIDEDKNRIIRINQQPDSQASLAKLCAVSWLTPQMDGLFLGSPLARRRFIDRLAIAFDPAHSGRVSRYEKFYRDRNRMLADGVIDAAWYHVNETLLAETGVAIMATRAALCADLNQISLNLDS